ncbi:MAG: alpha/beta hydrolase [Bacteroidetes bacterium]|nr:alpha/beta hydrolase [Bacteroidota bacterium]
MINRSVATSVSGTLLNVSATVRDAGNDLLVFLHGLGCSSETFRDIWKRPDFDAYSILCLDLPGCGSSDAPKAFSYSMEDQALVCAEVLSHYPTNDIHLICHSMGGAIGLLLPHEIINRTISFANIEGNLNPEDCVFGSREVSNVSFEVFVSELLPEFKRSSETWVKNGLESVSPFAFYESAKSLVSWSDSGKLLRAFHELSFRKVYIYGEHNADHPTVATVAGISNIEIKRAGHFVMNDSPDQFYNELSNFIRDKR